MKGRELIVIAALLAAAPAGADTLEERISELEKGHAELYHTLEEKKTGRAGVIIEDRLRLSGLIEVELSYEDLSLANGESETASDAVLATAQLGLNAVVTEHVTGTMILLYEEGKTDGLEIDEAPITPGNRGSRGSATSTFPSESSSATSCRTP